MRLLVILQCAYGNTAERRAALVDHETWLAGLWASHTGRRLAQMLPERGLVLSVVNASPEIGDGASAVFPPDREHLQGAVDEFGPDMILACGKVAQAAASAIGLQYIPAPHPAWRALPMVTTSEIRARLETYLESKRGGNA